MLLRVPFNNVSRAVCEYIDGDVIRTARARVARVTIDGTLIECPDTTVVVRVIVPQGDGRSGTMYIFRADRVRV